MKMKKRRSSHYKKKSWKESLSPEEILLSQFLCKQITAFYNSFTEYTRFTPEQFDRFTKLGFPDWKEYYFTDSSILLKTTEYLLSKDKKDLNNLTASIGDAFPFLEGLFPSIEKASKLTKIKEAPKELEDKLKTLYPRTALELIARVFQMASIISFGEPISALLEKGKKGDDQSLLKTIQVDKTILTLKWVQERLYKAQLLNEQTFLWDLSNAIKNNPISSKRSQINAFFFLLVSYRTGIFQKLSFNQMADFLKDNQVSNIDEHNLITLAHRFGMKKRKK